MVTTFSARFQSITNRCAPLLGKRRFDFQLSDISSATTMSSSDAKEDTATIDRNARDRDDNGCPFKKRRKQELAFVAANIEAALEQAGRPLISVKNLRRERALPTGTINLDLVKVVHASVYDDGSNTSKATNGLTAEKLKANESIQVDDQGNTIQNDSDIYYNAFYTNYAGLMQSTRHYYISLSTDSKFTNDDKKSESSSSTEGLSSFSPNSSNQDLNNSKKIDNDNRSDQSLDVDDSSAGSSSSDSRSPSPETKESEEDDENGAAYCVVG